MRICQFKHLGQLALIGLWLAGCGSPESGSNRQYQRSSPPPEPSPSPTPGGDPSPTPTPIPSPTPSPAGFTVGVLTDRTLYSLGQTMQIGLQVFPTVSFTGSGLVQIRRQDTGAVISQANIPAYNFAAGQAVQNDGTWSLASAYGFQSGRTYVLRFTLTASGSGQSAEAEKVFSIQ